MALLCSAQTRRLRSPQSKQVSRFAAGSQSPVKGRPKIAHGFNWFQLWVTGRKRPEPRRGERKCHTQRSGSAVPDGTHPVFAPKPTDESVGYFLSPYRAGGIGAMNRITTVKKSASRWRRRRAGSLPRNWRIWLRGGGLGWAGHRRCREREDRAAVATRNRVYSIHLMSSSRKRMAAVFGGERSSSRFRKMVAPGARSQDPVLSSNWVTNARLVIRRTWRLLSSLVRRLMARTRMGMFSGFSMKAS